MRNCLQLLIIVSLLLGSSAAWAQQAEYTISLPCLEQQGCRSPEIEAFFIEVYGRIGIQPQFAYMPRLRDLEEANSGRIDACAGRTKASYQPYSELIPVKTPVATETLVAFTANQDIKVNSWEDLTDLRVGVVRGAQLPVTLCKANGIDAYEANKLEQLFRSLEDSRIDAVVHHAQVGLNAANAFGIRVYLSPALHKDMVYHVLNSKHAALAPKLAMIFSEMLDDGTSARILGKWASVLPDPIE
ncbi:transporter substrate-binding domain-containing protein [Pseudodesulfovibrio sp. zrk46]|uniref:substrate-binding periplasmic protein n=1 Tax=Pseudodesulfovibrio sp. zrk46 TaxID=2725288 RepID=UPI001448F4AD|nr:transporter substrate-binding domain-containing protein [Pseudodesulfovibrio sp. zrk46]QJB55974.1 amino acid ABC transporter substrate-binding protein [Pseudodesulfovibrio sp. zrk46]